MIDPTRKTPPSRELHLSDSEARQLLARTTRRSFLVAGVATAAGLFGYRWLRSGQEDSGISRAQRAVLAANQRLTQAYFRDNRLAPEFPRSEAQGIRSNGDIGMDDNADDEHWIVHFEPGPAMPAREVPLEALKALPKVEMTTKLHCIEGWSAVVHWGGARLRDLVYQNASADLRALPPYVYLATPNREYYVGLDRQAALHPQTLLAYERDGNPLEDEHGAPLRLVIPVKYGIKNIKRVNLIRFTNQQPADYWAEQGYDWYAGL